MAKTEYQTENAEYSNVCHELARKVFYPRLFNVDPAMIRYEENTLLHESGRGQILDGEMGVDRLVRCSVRGLLGHTTFTIQERFRRPEYHKWRDLTVTEWNHASGQPSELSKINAGVFVYGYGNASGTGKLTDFLEVVAVNTTGLIHAVTCGSIKYKRDNNKKQQSFLAFTFKSLGNHGLIMYHYPSGWRPIKLSAPNEN
jgi:hypothetical protein